MNEKISYIKLPNITTNKLQDVVDFLEDNEIEYEEYYAEDLQNRIDKAIEYIESNSYFKDNSVKTMIFKDYSQGLLDILKESGE